jgi:hypothetical protein
MRQAVYYAKLEKKAGKPHEQVRAELLHQLATYTGVVQVVPPAATGIEVSPPKLRHGDNYLNSL